MSTSGGQQPAGSHKCVLCNGVLPTKEQLQEHFRKHANGDIDMRGRPKFQCRKTEKETKQSEETGNKDLLTQKGDIAVCDVCGEEFRTVSLAISHKFRRHPESIVKHFCPHCGMQFPLKLNRDKHLLTHTGNVPKKLFPCKSCGVVFYNEKARNFHSDSTHQRVIRLVNPIQTPAPSRKIVLNNAGEAQSVYYCHICGCEYQVKFNLQKHLQSRHTEEERNAVPAELVQCNLCSASFYSKKAYDTHNYHHNDTDLFVTTEEMRQQVVQRVDQDFDQRRVPSVIERYFSAAATSSQRSQTWKSIRAAQRKAFTTENSTTEQNNTESDLGLCLDDSGDIAESFQSSKSYEIDSTRSGEDFLNRSAYDETHDDMSTESVVSKDEREDELRPVDPDMVMPNSRVSVGSHANSKTVENQSKSDIQENKAASVTKGAAKRKSSTKEKRQAFADLLSDSDSDTELVVEKIVGVRVQNGCREFLVRWKGFEPADDTWEREEFLHCTELIIAFLQQNGEEKGRNQAVEWCEKKKPSRKKKKSKWKTDGDS
ncbi:uncharacterized protein LOC143033282 [Oratosquilla oratoria]|uniref:uncharacterized protein LOC143033282 n=1 Tax=Oratosquilla oratoria TaxID=337810 RepID=UPI003F767F24